MQLFEISAEEIDQVVAAFYARIRQHPELGPVFAAHIATEDWPDHEAKIASFWRNGILKERSYSGNPMQVHMAAGNVMPTHFSDWLGLFDEVLADQLPPDTARAFSALAHRIGRGLRMGLEHVHQPSDQPPILS
ncbi:MAG: group III truncated hemoglobin [Cognatishimia sp.]|uniref:group III truncated hemoglobin n=1 Tax=Cognatishimia sp. TaxID=2211648 RepID=UPI003B8DB66F